MSTLSAYQSLLVDYVPRPIRTEAEYRAALGRIEGLMRPRLSRAESEFVDLLAMLIEQYEAKEHPTPKSPPAEMLTHLMEVREVGQAEVARATGIPRSTISAVLAGRRRLSLGNIARLAGYFHVSPSAFMPEIRPESP